MSELDGNALIIGAGAAGSACAGLLRSQGIRVTQLDKGRQPGGRMATHERTSGSGQVLEADHGCPSFGVKDPRLSSLVDEWVHWGHAGAWRPRTQVGEALATAEPTLIGLPRMNALALALSGGRPHLGVTVERLFRKDAHWYAKDSNDHLWGPYQWAVVSVPAPQAEPLLSESEPLKRLAAQAHMTPTWSMIVGLKTPPLTSVERWIDPHPDVGLIINNLSKAGRAERGDMSTWVVHASAAFSREHLEDSPSHVQELLLARFALVLPFQSNEHLASNLSCARTHRWRYARVARPASSDGFLFDPELGLGACGDWCLGDGVEQAIISGRRLARRILSEQH